MIITETWLHPLIPDSAVQLTGRSIHRYDMTKSSGKSKGGGLCIYVHSDWCTSSRIIYTQCSPDLEVMIVQCRPFYMPRELTTVIISAVNIPPGANVSTALTQLYNIMNKQMQVHPEGAFIVAGDFNQACLKSVLPNFVQYVQCSTRGKNTLDKVYSNLKQAYRTVPFPH